MTRFLEDIAPGEVHEAGPVPVTREAIFAFARAYDPQPFHLDEAAGAASLLAGLAASGWHTSALGMRLFWDAFVRHVASMGAPGLDEVRWLRPVRPGDALSIVVKTGEVRASKSRPDRGLVALTLDIRNAAGTVMQQRGPLIVARRGAPAAEVAAAPAVTPPKAVEVPPAEPMLGAFLDEIEIGTEIAFGTEVFTAGSMVGFARLYDPQPFHVDLEAAARAPFGGLIASGWQTGAFWMKHYIAARERAAEARRAAGLPVAVGGPSPGFANLKWPRPVRPGDAIRYGLTVTGAAKTHRPGWGMVEAVAHGHVTNGHATTGHASDGACVLSAEVRLLWPLAPEAGQESAGA